MTTICGKLILWIVSIYSVAYQSLEVVGTRVFTQSIRAHFHKDGIWDVMKALRKEIPSSCIDISIEKNGNFVNTASPQLILELDSISNSQWNTLTSSPVFSNGCMTLYMLDIPSKSVYEKLLRLRRKRVIFYFLIASDNASDSRALLFNPDLNKEENIAVINKRNFNSWVVRTRQIYSPKGYLNTILSNVWRSSSGFAHNRKLFPEQMKNFHGHTLIGSNLAFLPLTDYEVIPNSLTVRPKPSLEVFMLDVISERLNFAYELRTPEDGQWGIKQLDGNWTGIVGDIQKEKANFGLSISISLERKKVCDFSMNYYFDPFTFVSRKIRQDSQWVKMLTPLQGEVWILLCVTFFVCCLLYLPLLKVKGVQKGEVNMNFDRSTFQLFGILVNQSRAYLPKKLSGRVFMVWWLLFTMLITCYYRTSLNATLVVPAVPPTLETLEELLDSGLQFGMNSAKGIEFSFFSSSTSEIHQSIFQKFNFYTTEESMEKVNSGKYAYIYYKSTIEDIVARQYTNAQGQTDMHMAREEIFASRYAWIFPKGAPYRRTINDVIMRCLESGLQLLWLKEMKQLTLQENPLTGSESEEEESRQIVFSMDHLKGVFAILIFGYCLSLIVFIVEVLKSKAPSQRAQNKMTS